MAKESMQVGSSSDYTGLPGLSSVEPNRKCNAQDRENDRDSIGFDMGYETLDDIKVGKSRNRLPSRACGERTA